MAMVTEVGEILLLQISPGICTQISPPPSLQASLCPLVRRDVNKRFRSRSPNSPERLQLSSVRAAPASPHLRPPEKEGLSSLSLSVCLNFLVPGTRNSAGISPTSLSPLPFLYWHRKLSRPLIWTQGPHNE